jgi:CheY-like chemotaxis protein
MESELTYDRGQGLVLIVEDQPDNREILRTVVEDFLGLRSVVATDGEAALRLAATLKPSVVVMDLMMPVLDGFGAIKHLKSRPETAAIPVVAISALSRSSDRQRALDAGADGYLSKPFDLDSLSAVIEEHVSRRAGVIEE